MSPYATKEQFLKMFSNTEIPESEIENLLITASSDVDSMTFNRIRACGFDFLTDFQREKVSRAVCRQADFRYQNEELFSGSIASYSINGVSVSYDKDRVVKVNGAVSSPDVYSELSQTGLCCRRL